MQVELRHFDLESSDRVTCDVGYLCANLVFLGLSVLDLDPIYATDRQTSDAHHRLVPPALGGGCIIIKFVKVRKRSSVNLVRTSKF